MPGYFLKGVSVMTDINVLIAKAICQAQIASDSGKEIYYLSLKNGAANSAKKYGYINKEKFMMKAIKIINTTHRGMFNYYCVDGLDQNGYPSILTYFDFKLNGIRYQISFHTPKNKASKELVKICGSGRTTRWNKEFGGSRDACQALIDYYKL